MDFDDEDETTLGDRFDAIDGTLDIEESRFDKIPDNEKLHPSRDLCALLKLASLTKDPSDFGLHGEHGVVLFSCNEGDFTHTLTDEEIIYLIRCGVGWYGEYDSFGMYASL